MNNIIEDIAFVKSIIPETYAVKESQAKGSIHCVSAPNTGFKKPGSDADDEEKWNIFFNTIKSHFGERFQETYCNTCTWYQDFIIYLKPKVDDGQEGKGLDGDYNTISGMPPSTEYIGAMSYTTKWVRELSFEQQTDLARMLDEFHAEQLAALPVADGEGK